MRDYVNWTDIAPSSNCPPEKLLYPQELSTTYSAQEKGLDRQRVLLDRHREKERLVHRGEVVNKWQTCSSSLHRREKEQLSVNSFRELEAWANRYYHSLPRQRHLEAGTWNTTQDLPESERMSRSASRLVSPEPAQRPLANTSAPHNQDKCNLNNRLRAQLEAWKAQQLPPYVPAKQTPSRRNTVLSPSFSHPPHYMSPPPYSSPQHSNILQVPGKSTSKASAEPVMEYRVESRPVTSAFPVQRRSEHSFVPLKEGRQHIVHPSSDRIPRALTCQDTDQARKQQILLNSLAESLTVQQQAVQKQEAAMPQQSSHQTSEKNLISYLDDALPKQSKPKRRRGGETVFCLVSRMGELAGLSSSPEEPLKSHSLPLLNVPTPGGPADVPKHSCEKQESQESVKLADEVDSESLMSHKVEGTPETPEVHLRYTKGESQYKTTDQILTDQEAANKERLRREIQETLLAKHAEKQSFNTSKDEEDPKITVLYKEDHADPCTSSKTTVSPQIPENLVAPQSNQTTVKFPLWKEPKWHYSSKGISQKKNETDQDISKVSQYGEEAAGQSKQSEVRNSINTVKDKGRGLVVIDATCVVVKVEFIFPPEKEHVQYVCSRSSDSYEHSPESLNLQVQNIDHNKTDTPGHTEKDLPANNSHELCVKILKQDDEDLMDRNPTHGSGDIVPDDPIQIPSKVISENETLKERAERILGITLLNSSNKEHTLDELPQISQTETDVQMVQDKPVGPSESKDDMGDRAGISQLTVVGSDNLETLTNQIIKEVPTLMTSTEEMLEESVDAFKTLQTHEVIRENVIKQENEGTSEDNEENFATQHIEAELRAAPATATTILQLNYTLEGKVNGSISNGTSGTNDLLPSLLDDCAEKATKSFHQEGSPREGSPSRECDVNNTCPTPPADIIKDNSEMFDQEGAASEGIFLNDLQNLCPTLLPDLPDGDLSIETGDGNNNNLCPVILGNYGENTNELIVQEGGSIESKPSKATDVLHSLCPPVVETYVKNACELYAQENAINLSDKNNGTKTICSPVVGNSVECTSEPLFSEVGTLPDVETNDLKKICPSIPDNSVEDASVLFSQEAPRSREDIPSNMIAEKDARDCHLLDETDGTKILSTGLGFLDDQMEYSCQRYDQDQNVTDANDPVKAGDIQNVCISVEDASDPENKPEEGSQSTEQDDASTLHLVLTTDSSDPFGKEGGPVECNFSNADSTGYLCPNICKKSEKNETQFVTGQEDNCQDFSASDQKDSIQTLSQTDIGSSDEDTFELSWQETIPINRPMEGNLLNEKEDVIDSCLAAFGDDMMSSHEVPVEEVTDDHEDNDDNGDMLLPDLPGLHYPTMHKQESTPQLPPESSPLRSSESPRQLDENSLLAPSLLEAFCSSQNSKEEPKLLSLSSETHDNTSPQPTPDLLDQSRPPENLPQTSSIHSEVWSPSSYTPMKLKKKQYPKSLWDAVNRIRKHTAPDSENEDEDGVELWEGTVGTVEDHSSDHTELQAQDAAMKEGRMGGMSVHFDGKEQSSDVFIISDLYLVDGTVRENIPLQEERYLDKVLWTAEVGQAEDDTLSSSSLGSHDSNDTVIEGEGNETTLETGKEGDATNEELHQEFNLIDENEGFLNEELGLSSASEEDNDCQISGVLKDNQ